jgi:hypothetical protein
VLIMQALEQKIRRSTGARARAAHKPQVVARPLPGIVPREVKPAPETSSFWIQLYNWCLRVVSHPDALKMFACTFLGLMAWKYWTNPSKRCALHHCQHLGDEKVCLSHGRLHSCLPHEFQTSGTSAR